MTDCRIRWVYAELIVYVSLLGLISRSYLVEDTAPVIFTYAGDTLWALALFLFLGFLFPRMRTGRLAVLTLAISFGVEISQFYQAEWINTIRGTRVGGLILGYGFKWMDLVCYAAGCLIGVVSAFFLK